MNILFSTFGDLSVGGGAIRSVSVLRALADAGYHVDVVAARVGLCDHPNIRVLAGDGDHRLSRQKLRMALFRALGGRTYQVVHAVDDAALYVARIAKLKRIKLVYEASRCFSGPKGTAPSWLWKQFPNHLQRMERKVLGRSSMVLSSSCELSADLEKLNGSAHIVQVEDIPIHPLFPRRDMERSSLVGRFDGRTSFIAVCSILPGNQNELRALLLAARKVIEQVPLAGFFFKGIPSKEASAMAANLDILGRCAFLAPDETELFLAVLGIADAALFVPQPGCRYASPEILTLLNSPALVVAIHDETYSALLTERNSVQVEFGAASIAEGLLRVVQEPLLSFGVVAEAQKLIADRHSFSSFKHRIRMAYHGIVKAE